MNLATASAIDSRRINQSVVSTAKPYMSLHHIHYCSRCNVALDFAEDPATSCRSFLHYHAAM